MSMIDDVDDGSGAPEKKLVVGVSVEMHKKLSEVAKLTGHSMQFFVRLGLEEVLSHYQIVPEKDFEKRLEGGEIDEYGNVVGAGAGVVGGSSMSAGAVDEEFGQAVYDEGGEGDEDEEFDPEFDEEGSGGAGEENDGEEDDEEGSVVFGDKDERGEYGDDDGEELDS